MTATQGNPNRVIEFTIDGRAFTISEPVQVASGLLKLAGLDANGYDLAELHGRNAPPKRYADDQRVRVQQGDRFVSIREKATVA